MAIRRRNRGELEEQRRNRRELEEQRRNRMELEGGKRNQMELEGRKRNQMYLEGGGSGGPGLPSDRALQPAGNQNYSICNHLCFTRERVWLVLEKSYKLLLM